VHILCACVQVGAVSTPTANVAQALEKCDGDANKLELLVSAKEAMILLCYNLE